MDGVPDDDVRRRWSLVLPHRERLVRVAIRRGLSRADAEDCAHEAMVRCVQFPALDETRVSEFLTTTTARLCVDRYRQVARDDRAAMRLQAWYADETSPEEGVCDRAEAAWVAKHVGALPESQRSALAYKAAGMSCGDVAARLGVSYKSVESMLSRARTQLRAAVASSLAMVLAAMRRGPAPAEVAAGVSLVAVVTLSVLLGTTGGGPAGGGEDAVPPAAAGRAVAGGRAAPAQVAATAEAEHVVRGGAPVSASELPAAASAAPAPQRSPLLPLPSWSPPPQPACGQPIPHVEPCLPLDDPNNGHVPGSNLMKCVKYGYDTRRGFECKESPTPTPRRSP